MKLARILDQIEPSATIAAAAKAKALKASGVDVLSFTLGEPDFDTPGHICDAAKAAMDAGQTHYTPAGGTAELKAAIAEHYLPGLGYAPSQVVVSNGAKHSIHNALTALLDPGDEVVIPTPYWVSYSDLVRLTGAKPVFVETSLESGFTMSADQLREAITPKTRLLMLNSPSNPTGSVWPESLLRELCEVCVEQDIVILTDEIYAQLTYEGVEAVSIATFGPEIRGRTVVVSGVSKAYAMTGWRIGWTLSPEPLAKGMDKLQSQETSCPSSVSQAAALAALTGPQDCVGEMLSAFAERRTYTLDRLRSIDGVKVGDPKGAFYAFFDVREHFGRPLGSKGTMVGNATDFATALIEDAHVATVTGDAFGAPGFIRLSYATDLKTLERGLDRLEAFLGG